MREDTWSFRLHFAKICIAGVGFITGMHALIDSDLHTGNRWPDALQIKVARFANAQKRRRLGKSITDRDVPTQSIEVEVQFRIERGAPAAQQPQIRREFVVHLFEDRFSSFESDFFKNPVNFKPLWNTF